MQSNFGAEKRAVTGTVNPSVLITVCADRLKTAKERQPAQRPFAFLGYLVDTPTPQM